MQVILIRARLDDRREEKVSEGQTVVCHLFEIQFGFSIWRTGGKKFHSS